MEDQARDEMREFLIHGMPKDELESLLSEIFLRCDEDQNGSLDRSEFLKCIKVRVWCCSYINA